MTEDDALTFDGITQPISEWALDYGVPGSLIIERLERGRPAERAITQPMFALQGQQLPPLPKEVLATLIPRMPKPKPMTSRKLRTYQYHGAALTVPELVKLSAVGEATLRYRIKTAWDVVRAVETPVLKVRRHQAPGVGENFPEPLGTGGGPHAQDFPEIEFLQ